MPARLPCRVQWVTRSQHMHELVEKLVRGGAVLVARSGYDASTGDLDAMADAEIGHLSIAEFKLDSGELRHQILEIVRRLSSGETLLVDLTGRRLKVLLLPVPGEHGVIIRKADGVHHLPRAKTGRHRQGTRWLNLQLAEDGQI